MKKLILVTLVLVSFTLLCGPTYGLPYFAPGWKEGLVFVNRSDLLYRRGDFSGFSWATSQLTNPGKGAEPAYMRKRMLGAPNDLTVIGEPDKSYILGKGGRTSLGFGELFAADGIINTLPSGKRDRKVWKILKGIDVAIFQDAKFAGGRIFAREPGQPQILLTQFGDNILNGKGFNVNDVAILLDLDQIEAADGKAFSRLIIKDLRGQCGPYFEVDAAGVKVIPEPATMLLFGLGAFGFGIFRRKRSF